jgi:hypothetical protein
VLSIAVLGKNFAQMGIFYPFVPFVFLFSENLFLFSLWKSSSKQRLLISYVRRPDHWPFLTMNDPADPYSEARS